MIDIMHPTEQIASSPSKGVGKVVGFTLLVCLILAVAGGGWAYWVRTHATAVTVVSPEASMAAVKEADTAWAKAAAAHNVEAVLSYYADGGYVLPPNLDAAPNKSSIRKVWTDLLVKGTEVSWTPGAADISSSGDLVYLEGYYLNTIHGSKGKTSLERGKYLSVWRKQADGTWKCVADTWNSDMPAKK